MLSKRKKWQEAVLKILHKFNRYTKYQKVFVVYLFLLAFCLIVLPIVKNSPIIGEGRSEHIFLLSGKFAKTMIVVLLSLLMLLGRNLSFKFKNLIVGYFGFKENESLFNFGFLWVIITAYLAIGDSINVINESTATISVTSSYYFIQILLLIGLILTLISLIKGVKSGNKVRIVNMTEDEQTKEVKHNREKFKGLFEEDDTDKNAN